MVRKVCTAGIFIGLLIIFGCGDVENSTATQNTNEMQGQVSTNTIEIKAPKETVNKVVVKEDESINKNQLLNLSEDDQFETTYISVITAYELAINDVYNKVLNSIVNVEVEYN